MTPHVQTYSGRMVPLDAPRPQMIALGDIAHALARIPRFNGHTTAPWSVADHSLLVLDLMPHSDPNVLLAALLHDAHEAYIGDITSPVAAAIRGNRDACPIDGLKVLFNVAIAAAFAFPAEWFHRPEIGIADRLALAIERERVMAPSATPWPNLAELPDTLPDMPTRTPQDAAEVFITTAFGLLAARHEVVLTYAPPLRAKVAA